MQDVYGPQISRDLYETLLQQYQAAVMAEASEGLVLQVIDPAIPLSLK